MGFTYKIFPERRIVYQRFSGAFSLPDLVSAARTVWSDPLYSKDYDGVVDLSSVSVKVSIDDLRALIRFLLTSECHSKGRWAAVAGSPLATACGMLYKAATSHHHPFEVFSTWEGASSFLGTDVSPVLLV
jgi:hypothetical protein